MNAPEAMVTESWRELPGARALGLRAACCLAARASEAACQRCADACPSGALTAGGLGPVLHGDCLGCGRCAAACPTGALRAEGFESRARLPDGNRPLAIDCRKVPSGIADSAGLRVPCLAGLTVARLLELAKSAQGRGVLLRDRGWCASCRAGRRPAHELLEDPLRESNALLSACGLPEVARIRIHSAPLPGALRADRVAASSVELRLGRRAFFAGIRQQFSRLADAVPAPPRAGLRRVAFPLPARERLHAALRSLAGAAVIALPAARISADCANHRVCAAACPTHALRPYEEAGAEGLEFDPRACASCGLCERLCPERALHIETALATAAPRGPLRLTRVTRRTCGSCGESFAASGTRALCPACATRERLARDLFGPVLARPRPHSEIFFRAPSGDPS